MRGLKRYRNLSVQCVEIPNSKRLEFSLQYIQGIGRTRAHQSLCDLNLENEITRALSDEELISVRDKVSKYMIKGYLRRLNALAIRRLKEIQCYQGMCHIQVLPCRGQHTTHEEQLQDIDG